MNVIGPEVVTAPQSQALNTGEVLKLNCTIRNSPGAAKNLTVFWTFTPPSGPEGRYFVQDKWVTLIDLGNDVFLSTFRAESVAPGDSGVYSCYAYNREISDAIVASAIISVSREYNYSHSPASFRGFHCEPDSECIIMQW